MEEKKKKKKGQTPIDEYCGKNVEVSREKLRRRCIKSGAGYFPVLYVRALFERRKVVLTTHAVDSAATGFNKEADIGPSAPPCMGC